jgi:hypothetical protein
MLIPVGALVMALSVGLPVEAGQRDSHGRDRNGRESQGQARERGGRPGGGEQPRAERPSGGYRAPQGVSPQYDRRGPDRGDRRVLPDRRDYGRAVPRDNYRYAPRVSPYRYDGYRGNYRYYGAPRIVPGRPHYYGRGGNFSVYFGLGSGYLFGSPYYGRVYGYVGPHAYGARVYYGDVRLLVEPRDAAVYVDGYYAGIVDDFDGAFQRLTIEVGPHQIELDAPGLEPQVFDVYVDPARTVDIHADLFR